MKLELSASFFRYLGILIYLITKIYCKESHIFVSTKLDETFLRS